MKKFLVLEWNLLGGRRRIFGYPLTIGKRCSSSVIFSAARQRPRLSALHLRDTCSILKPEFHYLAPCWGAALTASPLAGNLMRIGQAVHPDAPRHYSSSPTSQELFRASRLAGHLFFQLIRQSPLHVTRTKSLAASYLSPSLIGTLWGLGLGEEASPNTANVRRILRDRHGIKSNYIHSTEWTGVSLARWMDLLPANFDGHRHHDGKTRLPLTSAVWLMALWERSNSKLDFLECLINLEKVLPRNHSGVLDPCNPLTQALLNDPTAREEWADSTFSEEIDLSSDQVQGSYEQLMLHHASGSMTNRQQDDAAAIEILCAAISLNHVPGKSKPACPTGYYAFDGGGIQADCAEHTVREVINLLLWDEAGARFDLGRLPPTASKRLGQLYDERMYPFHESGGMWFDLLSDLPGCDYFLKSPNGRPYELVPTIPNILRALQILLLGYGTVKVDPEWTSFQDLKNAWQPKNLMVYESTLTHRSSTSGELIHHEFATLQLENASSGIELRLRCDMTHMSGMSKVTHLRERSPMVIDRQECMTEAHESATNQMLGLCLGADAIVSTDRSHLSQIESTSSLIPMLATPFGCDRRRLLKSDLSESDRVTMQRDSEELLKSAIIISCHQSQQDELFCATLLPWLLNESPTVFESTLPIVREVDREVEDWILSLPQSILGNNTVHDALEFNWAVRGQPLKAWARWTSGHHSITDEIMGLSMSDMPIFLKLALTR